MGNLSTKQGGGMKNGLPCPVDATPNGIMGDLSEKSLDKKA